MKNYKYALAVMAIAFTYCLTATTTYAATSPGLGSLSTFGIVSETSTNANTAPYTIVTGSSCGTTLTVPRPLTITGGVEETPCAPAKGTDQTAAKADLNLQAAAVTCMNIGPAPALNAVDIDGGGPLPAGTFTPGCYKTDTGMSITLGTTVTLSGAGTYIFKSGGALTTGDDSKIVLSGGASACDVFWVPVGATTIGAYTGALPNPNNSFVGNIFRGDAPGLSITLGHFATLLGRTLAFGSTVTTDANTITVPTCAAPAGGGRGHEATINVVKTVINDNGGTKKVSDFPLFVNDTSVSSGETNYFPAPADAYWITETKNSNYAQTFSGDCDKNGSLGAYPGQNYFCIVTNNDIGAPVVVPPVPPLIEVVKVPAPLSLPGGPGVVKYTYTLTNIGTVPVTDVTMVGDTCSPIALVSGDINSDNKLDLDETWVHTCSTRLTETHTNTVVATGWANGISAVDVASATVVVGQPLVPPLIHVTKHPNPLTLTAGGGWVTYTNKVTNPGTVPLSNVRLSDDRCDPVKFVSGDRNNDEKLDPTETWTYSCRSNLTATTTNTVVARGEANGFVVRDFAVATVVVATAVPKLPNTGFAPVDSVLVWPAIASGFLAISILVYLLRKKQTL